MAGRRPPDRRYGTRWPRRGPGQDTRRGTRDVDCRPSRARWSRRGTDQGDGPSRRTWSRIGKKVVSALVGACTTAGIEVITLGVRGNNHGAISLYEACGFRTWGVLPNAVAVDDLRFDDVRMFLPLALPTGVRIHGSIAGGPGSSARHRATRQ
ncbi:GNAT family N-acetyltransferase [Micromonospora sp. CPCC 205539]|uniref:GNAT family N-acetyltransferase n=1 Tax=Micromonospora sp. CPCC 205539 TaxID=3122408 RepID=UPI003FA5B49B